jgi:hypothetical protein
MFLNAKNKWSVIDKKLQYSDKFQCQQAQVVIRKIKINDIIYRIVTKLYFVLHYYVSFGSLTVRI